MYIGMECPPRRTTTTYARTPYSVQSVCMQVGSMHACKRLMSMCLSTHLPRLPRNRCCCLGRSPTPGLCCQATVSAPLRFAAALSVLVFLLIEIKLNRYMQPSAGIPWQTKFLKRTRLVRVTRYCILCSSCPCSRLLRRISAKRGNGGWPWKEVVGFGRRAS
jgi:hypothetical protein